jgi:long-chain acyl-CoA synthetase
MKRNAFALAAACLLLLPLAAGAVVEPKTETEYPDQLSVDLGGQEAALTATGVGLREKTFMKVDVYTIVSCVQAGADLGDDPGAKLRTLDAPKRIQMDLRRGFSREKLVDSFQNVIDKNYDDTAPFAAELETFMAYFDRDAQEGDRIVFDYAPTMGVTTTLNGEVKGTIAGTAFMEALWTVWFGEKPADGGLKKALLSAL